MQEDIEKLQNVDGCLDIKVRDIKMFVNEVCHYPLSLCVSEEEEIKAN